jgi:hypothetical protein
MLIHYVIPIKPSSVIFMMAISSLFLLFVFHPIAFATDNDLISFNLSKGYVNGEIKLFIATDSSDNQTASSITQSLGQAINFAPLLTEVPRPLLQQGYDFVNGVEGEGSFGFQIPVSSASPGDKDYSPLVQLNLVKWNDGTDARVLKSSEEIQQAQRNGEIEIMKTNITINSPLIQQKPSP